MRLSSKDILEIQKICNRNSEEADSEIQFDLTKAEVLFRCEACQEMPISSETVHTCEFGHQVCGCCYNVGVRTCVVCKGHLHGNNVPLENVLRRLRQNYPHMFNNVTPPSHDGVDTVSRFYSLKPIECPEDGCKCQSSARSLPTHFRTEHKHVPAIDVPLFKPCTVLLPKRSLENLNGIVVALVNLKITDENIASGMFTDTMTCWVQCGAIDMGKDKAVAVWVSCAYEEALMPPILYNVRVSTADGYSSFGGQMITLHDYKDPKSVLADGKCLLLFPKALQNAGSHCETNLIVELKFYLR